MHDITEFKKTLISNRKAFVRNNIMRIRQMMRYSTPGFRKVFQTIPFLLQMNKPQTTGYVKGGDAARGIFGFERSGFARIYKETHPSNSLKPLMVAKPIIKSLLLIGSTGSVGHTASSDLDYWVCIDGTERDPDDLALLNEKLDLISEWAEKSHQTEVHFFVLELHDILANRMGGLDEDSSGDVMPRLLKEEFYRTLLHVAGRMPLWWAVPMDLDSEGYQDIAASVNQIQSTTFDPFDLIDLGWVEYPPPKEYLGAAMWQAHKAHRDPFKAVLKMTLILEQVMENFQSLLLCDELKKLVLTANPEHLPVDPYLLTVKRALSCTSKHMPEMLDLVRISALFKLSAPWDRDHPDAPDPKAPILNELTREWGWNETRIKDLYSYITWPERRKLALGKEIKALILDLYSRIASKLRADYPVQIRLEDESLTMLNAQILATWAENAAKVEDLPSAFHRRSLPSALTITYQDGQWLVHGPGETATDYIYSAHRIARIAAWVVSNGIFRPELKLRLRTADIQLKSRSFFNLLKTISDRFPPLSITAFEDRSLLSRPHGTRLLILNMEEPENEFLVRTAEAVYRTTLGEMYHEELQIATALSEAEKYTEVARWLMDHGGAGLKELVLFVPVGQAQEELHMNLTSALKKYWQQRTRSSQSANKSKSKLDMG